MTERKEAVWELTDLGFFTGALLPIILLASLIASLLPMGGWRDLIFQALLYVLTTAVLYMLAHGRHAVSFTEALNWTLRFRRAWLYVIAAPPLVLLVSVIHEVLRAPLLPNAVDQLTAQGVPLPVVTVLAALVGPLWEELAFRGFVQPALQRRFGLKQGLLWASALFSLLHQSRYEWQWQYFIVLFVVGLTFGVVRHRTGSTAASFLLHMGYNLTPFVWTAITQNL